MRVLVTGASGDFGSCIIPEVLGRGHEVVGLSRRQHSFPSPRYRHVSADIRDAAAVAGAMSGVDAVIHLAWTTHPSHDLEATRAIDVGGTAAVLDAMQREGISRLISASSVMAYGANADNPTRLVESDPLRPSRLQAYSVHKAEVEGLISSAAVNALIVRATNIMGRGCTGVTQEGFATPVILGLRGARNEMQFVHPDDLARFFADALDRPEWSGPVNLAAEGSMTMAEVAEVLGKRYAELPAKQAAAVLSFLWNRGWFSLDPGAIEALVHFPLVDTRLLTDEFGFKCAWTARECVEDFSRTNRDHVFLGTRKISIPWRWPWAWVTKAPSDTPDRKPAAEPGVAGEFDSTVHPNWTVFTAANTSEAFPGPMTPLSLELSLETLRAGGAQATEVLRLDGELKRVLREEPIASFGHGIYANLSAIYAMGSVMPGGAATAYQDMLFGDGAELPEFDRIGRWGIARRLPLIAAQLTGFGAELRDIAATARASQHDASYYATLTDAQLQARLLRTRDEIAQCWAGSGQATAFVVPLMSLLEKQAGKGFATRIRGGTSELMSAGIASGAYKLADIARADSDISATLCNHSGEEALQILRKNQPEFAQALDTVINEYGHRGPRETELANPVFADTPGRLLDVVAKLLNTTTRQAEPAAPLSTRLQLLASVGSRFQRSREQVRDATIRQTHQYRLIARELGTRLARKGVIDAPEDVFYLVRAELKNPPENAKELIARRRAERQRLEVQRPPLHIVGSWQPTTDGPSELAAGESLQGIPVSAGIAKGTARILTVDSMDELEPGEILVTAFTDTGWTPFFAYAAAVVVDTGGEMSHAAVVAREFGIPCVVNTVTGSSALRTGHVLEVDGATGRVTRVE